MQNQRKRNDKPAAIGLAVNLIGNSREDQTISTEKKGAEEMVEFEEESREW